MRKLIVTITVGLLFSLVSSMSLAALPMHGSFDEIRSQDKYSHSFNTHGEYYDFTKTHHYNIEFDDMSHHSHKYYTPPAVPEPATWLLILSGFSIIIFLVKKRAK
jgi:hypothetical protein